MSPYEMSCEKLHSYLYTRIEPRWRDLHPESFFADDTPHQPVRLSRREQLKDRLENEPLPWPLRVALRSIRRQHRGTRRYGDVDALVDLLTTLKPDSDAGVEARYFASKAGMPVEGPVIREELVAWLEGGLPVAASQHEGSGTASVVIAQAHGQGLVVEKEEKL